MRRRVVGRAGGEPEGRRRQRRSAALSLLVLVSGLAAACTADLRASGVPMTGTATAASSFAAPPASSPALNGSSAPPGEPASPSPAPRADGSGSAETRPPSASIVDIDGSPVAGQVGSFAWAGVVSDSPLLPGTPVRVRRGVVFDVVVDGLAPTTWTARLFVDPGDPTSGSPLGAGTGAVRIRAPDDAGEWTLVVRVFSGAGDVSYFWRLSVT
jgi:hypothetical protein